MAPLLRFAFTTELEAGERRIAPSFREVEDGTYLLWRSRPLFPYIHVVRETADGNPDAPAGPTVVLWNVLSEAEDRDGLLEPTLRCDHCPDTTHLLGFRRKGTAAKKVETAPPADCGRMLSADDLGRTWDDLAASCAADAGEGEGEAFPTVQYGVLDPETAAVTVKAFIDCNSHFHGNSYFRVKAQVVELAADGSRTVVRVDEAVGPAFKVVAKFIATSGGSQPTSNIVEAPADKRQPRHRKSSRRKAVAASASAGGTSSKTTKKKKKKKKQKKKGRTGNKDKEDKKDHGGREAMTAAPSAMAANPVASRGNSQPAEMMDFDVSALVALVSAAPAVKHQIAATAAAAAAAAAPGAGVSDTSPPQSPTGSAASSFAWKLSPEEIKGPMAGKKRKRVDLDLAATAGAAGAEAVAINPAGTEPDLGLLEDVMANLFLGADGLGVAAGLGPVDERDYQPPRHKRRFKEPSLVAAEIEAGADYARIRRDLVNHVIGGGGGKDDGNVINGSVGGGYDAVRGPLAPSLAMLAPFGVNAVDLSLMGGAMLGPAKAFPSSAPGVVGVPSIASTNESDPADDLISAFHALSLDTQRSVIARLLEDEATGAVVRAAVVATGSGAGSTDGLASQAANQGVDAMALLGAAEYAGGSHADTGSGVGGLGGFGSTMGIAFGAGDPVFGGGGWSPNSALAFDL